MEKNLMRLRQAINIQPGLATVSLTAEQLHQIASGLQLAAEYGQTDHLETWGLWAMFFEATAQATENEPIEKNKNGVIMGGNHDEA